MVNLLDPLVVRGLMLKNRIVMPPMHTGLATSEGAVTEELIKHYTQRAKALGLLIVEHSYITLNGKLSEKQLGIYSDSLIPGLKRLCDSIHAAGTPVVIQINHAGGSANMEITGTIPVAPSPYGGARMLEKSEIEDLVEAFTLSAERAMRAGFDGVEIHGHMDFYLTNSFLP